MDNMQINNDAEYEKLAIDTIRLHAIHEKASNIRRSLETRQDKAVVRSMYRTGLRVAAILILIVGSASVYEFMATSDQSVYNKQFINYNLSTTRGSETRDKESEAYKNGNWNEVITMYHSTDNKSNRNAFLAAMSEMQLSHFQEAVNLFETILNTKSGDHSFREETEYYLSLAYLMNHQELRGMRLMNKIKGDSNHTYAPLADKLSGIDMRIIELKNK
jgi:hypothetical protein